MFLKLTSNQLVVVVTLNTQSSASGTPDDKDEEKYDTCGVEQIDVSSMVMDAYTFLFASF